ncbi:MAG: hypothetical protein CMP01_03620 [Woeseiaceae bacterium]|nr:hypothetical protein [Woeseiaceae bacterium]
MLRIVITTLGWLGASLVFIAAAGRFLRADMQDVWFWCSVAGFICLCLYMLSQWRDIIRLFSTRQTRYGSLALASIVLVLGILTAINYIASRQNRRWDLTAAKQFTLSDQTIRILETLEGPAKILVFDRENDFDRLRMRLGEYENVTDHVSVDYIDIDKQPSRARQYQIQTYGTVVFEYQDRVERVVANTEQDLTNALIKAIEGTERTVYFVQGHDEKNVRSAERDGYNTIGNALELDNFFVETLVLAQQTEVPADASMLIIAGPRTDLLESEIETLQQYLERGGKVLFLMDPSAELEPAQQANIRTLLSRWGVTLGDDIVFDGSAMGQLLGTDASMPVAADYPSHPITDRFNVLTAFPLARSVEPTPGETSNLVAEAFLQTGNQSWAETDIARLTETGEVEREENQGDRPGPVTIGVAVTAAISNSTAETGNAPISEQAKSTAATEPTSDTSTLLEGAANPSGDGQNIETRLVVVGDSDFAANYSLGIQGNRDLFLNIANWLTQQETLVAIRPREPEDRRITLTADQQLRILWLSVFMIPGVVLGTGIYTWWLGRQ